MGYKLHIGFNNMMSDSEELPILHNDTISSSREENFDVFCVIPMKFPNNIKFTLFNWKKLMIVAWGIQMMFFMSVVGLIKPEWELYVKISIITAVVSPLIGYMMVLLNMFNGGWGRENSKFWCHMRIMYLAGYNSIRWAISSAVDPCIIIAACLIMGENNSNSIRAAITIIYCYFILHRLEQEKSSPVEWDKFKDDFDVSLKAVHYIQTRNVKGIGIEPIIICALLTLIPWMITGWNVGFFIMLYQIAICINAYRYTNSSQTFVQTDIQYDIIQMIFRTGLLWTFIWL